MTKLVSITRLDEGTLDFIRGASRNVGQKVAQSAPVAATRDIYRAGQQASRTADFGREVDALARLIVQYDKIKAASQQTNQQPSDLVQRAAPTGQPQTGQPASSATPAAFRTTEKPKGQMGKHGFEYTFSSFVRDTHGEQLNEGVWDFVKGAGVAAGAKIRDQINNYADRAGSTLSDIYRAGKHASAQGDATRVESQLAQTQSAADQQLAKVVAATQQMGDNGLNALEQSLRKYPQVVQQRVHRLVIKRLSLNRSQ